MSPLTIGDIQLDDTVKLAFSRQIRTVARLRLSLRTADGNDSSCRITRNVFANVLRRPESFLRVMNLTDRSESFSVDREIPIT